MTVGQDDADRAFRRHQRRLIKRKHEGVPLSFDEFDRRLWEAGRRYGIRQRGCCNRPRCAACTTDSKVQPCLACLLLYCDSCGPDHVCRKEAKEPTP